MLVTSSIAFPRDITLRVGNRLKLTLLQTRRTKRKRLRLIEHFNGRIPAGAANHAGKILGGFCSSPIWLLAFNDRLSSWILESRLGTFQSAKSGTRTSITWPHTTDQLPREDELAVISTATDYEFRYMKKF